MVCCFLVVYYTEAWVSENEASAEHETSQLYKYYTFLLLSQLFYQCYGINTAIDILYEYKWSLLFFTRRGGVNDVFWAGRLDSVFSISLLHRNWKTDSDTNPTVGCDKQDICFHAKLQTGSQASQTEFQTTEAESGRGC